MNVNDGDPMRAQFIIQVKIHASSKINEKRIWIAKKSEIDGKVRIIKSQFFLLFRIGVGPVETTTKKDIDW